MEEMEGHLVPPSSYLDMSEQPLVIDFPHSEPRNRPYSPIGQRWFGVSHPREYAYPLTIGKFQRGAITQNMIEMKVNMTNIQIITKKNIS